LTSLPAQRDVSQEILRFIWNGGRSLFQLRFDTIASFFVSARAKTVKYLRRSLSNFREISPEIYPFCAAGIC
jgi:hypothetical protein